MAINNEDYANTILAAQPFSHFHISEPNLVPVPQSVHHVKVAAILKKINYDKWVSIEMKAGESKTHCVQIEKTLEFVTKTYQ